MVNVAHVAVLDPEVEIREVCISLLDNLGYKATGLESAEALWRLLETEPVDLVLMDLRLPDQRGLELLQRLKQFWPQMPVLILTAYASVGGAVDAMKLGAGDYITKPFDLEEMRLLLQTWLHRLNVENEHRQVRENGPKRSGLGNLIGTSPAMQAIFRMIVKVAQNRYPVLLLGESGTGKELVGRALHYQSAHRDRPFIPVDCSSLVPTLIESELFGYVKGAFTGAHRNHAGLLEVASGGTVFLDEIGELPLDLQAKLLRAIQEKEIRPVGGTRRIPIDVRLVAATNRDLQVAVAQGSFRKDLFFRLNVVNIKLPTLRERVSDIPLLVEHFLEKYNLPGQPAKSFDAQAMAQIMRYSWPGNVRELENCVERAVALSSGPEMQLGDLPSPLREWNASMPISGSGIHGIRSLAVIERDAIQHAMGVVKGDKLLAAKLLGIGKTTLYRKLKEYAYLAATPPNLEPLASPLAPQPAPLAHARSAGLSNL